MRLSPRESADGPRLKPGCEIVIRAHGPDDIPFIMREWLRTYSQSEWAKRIDRDTFFRHHHAYATVLMQRTGAVVAAFPDAPDVLCGFLVGSGQQMHYAFVKGLFRRWGIGAEMVQHVFGDKQIQYSHSTHDGRALLSRRQARYNPYL